MRKRILAVLLCAVVAIGLAACSQSQQTQNAAPQKADDTAMQTIASGLEKRWDVVEDQASSGTSETKEAYQADVQAELDMDSALKDASFDNTQMQEDVLAYINVLNDSMDVTNNYGFGTSDFYLKWEDVYNERTALIKKFVDDYGLTVDSEHQSDLDDLVANGTNVQNKNQADEELAALFDNVTFDKTDEGYGWYTYDATVENTTSRTYKNLSLTLALYDSDGVRQGETYAFLNTWSAGEKVKVEGQSDIDAATVKVETPEYYELDE